MGIEQIPAHLLERLQKLKNMQDGAAAIGSYEESSNAAAKFQALLLKHNLDEATFNRASFDHASEMGEDFIETDQKWAYRLIQVVSRSCMCEVLYGRSFKFKGNVARKYTVLGEKTNVAVAMYMVESLFTKIDIARRMSWDKYEGEETRQQFKKGFLFGCVDAICLRLIMEERNATKTDQAMAVVLFDRRKQANEFMMQKYPRTRIVEARGYDRGGYSGYQSGQAAGRDMSFDKGITGGSKNQKKLGNGN